MSSNSPDLKRKFYSSVSEQFDKLVNPYDTSRRLEIIFDELIDFPLAGCLVLDAGCGTGYVSRQAIQRGARLVSMDISFGQLIQAKKGGSHQLSAGDALNLPFADGAFDCVLSSEMIEHTLNPRQAVSELGRVLKPGGRLVLTCPNHDWQWLVDLASRLKLRPFAGYENFPSFASLEQYFMDASLLVERHSGFHPWPFQIKALWQLSRRVDQRWGASHWGRHMINQAVLAKKTG